MQTKRSDAGDPLRLGAGALDAHARDFGACGDDVFELDAPREREDIARALEGRLDFAALHEEERAVAHIGVFEGRADLGEGRWLAAEKFAEDPKREFAAHDGRLAGLRADGGRLVEIPRERGRTRGEPGGLAGEEHEPVVGKFVAERVEALPLKRREDRSAELERAERAGHQRGELGGLGGREVEDDNLHGRLGVDEVDMPELALDDHRLARVGGGGRGERVGVHHVNARILEIHGRVRKGQHFDIGDRPEEALRLLFHDTRNSRVVAAAEDREVRAHIRGALAERAVHGVVREGEFHLDDGDIRAVLGDHARPIGGAA